jgi:hypothetical protein
LTTTLTAHAQKPESTEILDESHLPKWIESHCVAVEREGRDIQHPADDDEKENLDYMIPPINIRPVHSKPWTEHIPEHTLHLKCAEEKAK